ncbi:NUDIX domain-containing protein [Mesorhizobium sp. ArgA1]
MEGRVAVLNVNILVRDSKRRTLLQFRDAFAPVFALRWGLWGGRLSTSDETPAHGAAREIREELELAATPEDFSLLDVRTSTKGDSYLFLFRHTVEWGDFRVREGAGAAYFWRSEIVRLPLAKPVEAHLVTAPELFGEAPALRRAGIATSPGGQAPAPAGIATLPGPLTELPWQKDKLRGT